VKINIHNLSYVAEFLLEGGMFPTDAVDKIKRQCLCSVIFFNRVVYEITWRTVQITDEKMAHAHSMLDT
jgi:hypothetical protein